MPKRRKSLRERCISCGRREWSEFTSSGGYAIEECKRCGLGRTKLKAVDRKKVAGAFYAEAYREFYLEEETASRLKRRFLGFVQRSRPWLSEVRRVLDVGCSYGYFLEVAADLGWEAVGLEPNQTIFREACKKFPLGKIRNATLAEARFERPFDLVSYWDVLEHVEDPAAELRRVREVLRPWGYLVVHCPNKESWGAKISGSSWGWWSPPDHVYHFTLNSLVQLVKRAGFSPIAQWTYNDEEEVVRGWFNRFSPRSFPRVAAYFELGHQVIQRLGLPILYPLRLIEGKLGRAGLILLLAQRVEK